MATQFRAFGPESQQPRALDARLKYLLDQDGARLTRPGRAIWVTIASLVTEAAWGRVAMKGRGGHP